MCVCVRGRCTWAGVRESLGFSYVAQGTTKGVVHGVTYGNAKDFLAPALLRKNMRDGDCDAVSRLVWGWCLY